MLVIVEQEVPADRRYLDGQGHAQAPPCQVDFMDSLVSQIAVAGIPDPVPVVMEAILGERLHRSGTGPKVVVNARGHRFRVRMADRCSPFVTESARHVDIADRAALHLVHRFTNRSAGPALASVFANDFVLVDGLDKLPAFPPVVRAGLLDVNIFSGLRCPDAHQGMPVIGCGNRDGIDVLVVQQLPELDDRLRRRHAELFRLAHPFPQHVLVYIAKSGQLYARKRVVTGHVIPPAAIQAHDGDSDAVVRA